MLGSTGEATSFSREERKRVMDATRRPACRSTDDGRHRRRGRGRRGGADRHASELGFAGALVLPPFYDRACPTTACRLYRHNRQGDRAEADPDLSLSLPAAVRPALARALVKRLLDTFGTRIVGLKDSSGDMDYAREAAAISKSFDVFPSTEAVLLDARGGAFAGCISATANLNSDLCQLAWAKGDKAALDAAVTIRNCSTASRWFPGVKALLAHIHGDPALARMKPPLAPFSAADRAGAVAGYDRFAASASLDGYGTKIAIIGGGIGGLTAAISLLQAGYDVQVYEQSRLLARSAPASTSARTPRAS